VPVIGYLNASSPDVDSDRMRMRAFHQGLGEIGYVEGATWRSSIAGRRSTTIYCRLWRRLGRRRVAAIVCLWHSVDRGGKGGDCHHSNRFTGGFDRSLLDLSRAWPGGRQSHRCDVARADSRRSGSNCCTTCAHGKEHCPTCRAGQSRQRRTQSRGFQRALVSSMWSPISLTRSANATSKPFLQPWRGCAPAPRDRQYRAFHLAGRQLGALTLRTQYPRFSNLASSPRRAPDELR